MDGDGGGSSSGDVSSTAADEGTRADHPELPPPGPSENDAALLRQFARAYGGRLVLSRMPLGGPNTGRSAIFFESTRDDGGDGGGDPRRGDADADADADTGADDDDDAYGGLGFSFGAVPASGVAIACLPETKMGEGEREARESASGHCAVCLEEYEAGDALRTMPCAHVFHERCIFQWLRASRLCPLCRFALPPEERHHGGEADVDEDVR